MRIAIDCGHTITGVGQGASGYIVESTETRALGGLVMKYLKELGHTVTDCTVDSASTVNASLSAIVSKEKASNSEFFLSIHFNAYNGSSYGTEVYVVNGASTNTKNRATAINNEIVKACGFYNRGLKAKDFYVIKNTNASAALIEVCFVDNINDYNKYNRDKVARAIVKGITGQEVPVVTTKYRVVVGTYSDRNNAIAMQDKLKQAGFDSFLATV